MATGDKGIGGGGGPSAGFRTGALPPGSASPVPDAAVIPRMVPGASDLQAEPGADAKEALSDTGGELTDEGIETARGAEESLKSETTSSSVVESDEGGDQESEPDGGDAGVQPDASDLSPGKIMAAEQTARGASKLARGVRAVDGSQDAADDAAAEPSAGADIAKGAVGGVAVGGAAHVVAIMMLLQFLKQMLAMVQAMIHNLLTSIMAFIANMISSVVGTVVAFGSGIAGALGLSTLVGAVVAGAGIIGAIFVTVVGLFSGSSSSAAQYDDPVLSCLMSADVKAAVDSADPTDISERELANAKEVYAVLAGWGMPDANIAGIIGNWQAESRIDPTSVEGIFNAPYVMNPQKKALATDTNKGIGLGQWTFGRNANLRKFADKLGKSWWTLEVQLSYMLSSGEGSDANVVRDMILNDLGDPSTAAKHFHDKWERSADTASMAQRRLDKAEAIFPLLSGWEVDVQLADSLLNQAGTTLEDANDKQVARAKANCRSMDTVDVALADGGMTDEDAQALVDLYNREGDGFLDGRYGEYGGPGSCGTDHAMNCVSFSTYFLNKYTTFQTYPGGNGIDTAGRVAQALGRKLTTTPVAYSVGSGPGSGPAGHTLVVLAVEGDVVTIGEAGYCKFRGVIAKRSAAAMKAAGWKFVDVSDLMLSPEEVKVA